MHSCYKISPLKCIFLLFLKNCRLSFNCIDAEGTTPRMEEVEQCKEQLPRAMHGAMHGAIADDCMDAGGRATQGAVAEKTKKLSILRNYHERLTG